MPHIQSRTALGLIILTLVSPLSAQSAPKGVSRGDLFIQSFGPSPSSTGLRASRLEQEEQVRLAFYGIDATRVQMEVGSVTEEDGNRYIDGFEQTIRNYTDDRSKEGNIVAAAGQVSDMPAISRQLTGLIGIARQDALLGREELAQEAQARMVNILVTFSQKFAETCDKQDFPPEVALAIERQNQMLGTGISVYHCANRKLTADISKNGVNFHFETCTFLGSDAWKLTLAGLVAGEGEGDTMWDPTHTAGINGSGQWSATVRYKNQSFEPFGEMMLVKQEVPAKNTPVAAPNDAGPNAKPNGWPKQPVPEASSVLPEKVIIEKLRITTIKVTKDYYAGWADDWAEGEIKHENKACKVAGS